MNNIITTQKSETLTSMEVAEMIGKEHNKLMRDIRRYINQLGEAKIGHTVFSQKQLIYQNKIRSCLVLM